MNRLKKGRRPVRGQITKLINSVETALKKPVEELDKTDLRVSALQLEDLCRDLHEWDEKVTEAMLDEEVTEDEQDKEYDERLRYDRLIKRMREELEKVLNPKKGVSPQSDETSSDTSNSTSRRRVLLPKRKLPVFGGDVREWITFWSRFEDIHNDEDLSDSDKYQYLVDCMLENSEAQQLVLSYPVSGKNYASVIKDLKERFGRDNMLIKVYVRDLLWLVIRSAQERKVNFKDLVTKLNSQIRHLSMLGVTTDKCADILYPVVESCLPEDVLISWQRSSEPEDLESLMKFLRREVNQTKDREMAYNKHSDSLAQPTPGKIETKKRSFNARREIATTSGFMHSDISPTLREKFKCIFCDNGHPSQDCRKGMKMGMDQKNEKIKSYKRCFKCLLPGHRSRQCKKKVRCDFCKRDGHYAIMCRGVHHAETETKSPQRPQNSTPTPGSSDVATVNEMSNCVSTKACLETLLVKVWGPKGSKVVRAVIDSGSSQSYILEHIVKDLGVPIMGEEELDHEIFGGIRYTDRHRIYCLTLSSIENDRCISCPASATNQIARCIRKPTFGSWARELASKKIQLSAFKAESDEVELLLGADINPKIATANMIRLSDDLIARETLLGWVVQGKTEGKFPDKNPNQVHNSMLITSLMTQEIKVSDLWSLENIGVMDDGQAESKKESDQAIMDKFRTETKRLESGRYEVHLPWIEPAQKLKENKSHAEKRLRKMTEDLKKRGFYHHYNKIFEEWEENGIIERIHSDQDDTLEYFLPHRAVVKSGSSTTPVRPVFDASCKTKGGWSLNDCLAKGPNLLELIPDIMLRFRLNKIGVVADIEKAFLQISVAKEDRQFLRFLWWEDGKQENLRIYQHKRVVFGVTSSPFLLAATLKLHLEQYEREVIPLLKCMYMDNCVNSVTSLEEAQVFQQQSIDLLSPAGFNLREWQMGGPGIVNGENISVLGMKWDTADDTLTISDKLMMTPTYKSLDQENDAEIENQTRKLTKRIMLSEAHAVFDPLGLFSPFTIVPKIILQQCWKSELKWDQPVPEDIVKKFVEWQSQIPELLSVRIPRWVMRDGFEQPSLHVFCDASQDAYATCIYLRTMKNEEVNVQLIASKSRVAPKKKLTIPRLELMSCLIGSRLTKQVMKIISESIAISENNIWFWTDSSTALRWIQNEKPWATFVRNRVNEICSISKKENWHHVSGANNPADLPSRGSSVKKLIEHKWWEGPSFLWGEEASWNQFDPIFDEEEINKELKKTVNIAVNSTKDNFMDKLERYGDYHRIVRIVAYLLRFKRKTVSDQSRPRQHDKMSKEISVEEFEEAEKVVLRHIQLISFGRDDKRINKLNAFTDEYGLYRIKSQLYFGEDDYDTRCPIVLPGENQVVKLLIRKEHEMMSHAGIQTTQQLVRRRFWILKGKRTIRSIISACATCRRYNSKRVQTESIPIPATRIGSTPAFGVIGVDLAGPLTESGGKKIWVVLYTCAVYRAVHLELTKTVSTEGFLDTFRRFVARRGRPSIVYSDNGLNFVGCNNLFKKVNWNDVLRYATVQRIKWNFNPPTAAFWGGWWERLVGLMKQLIRKVLGDKTVSYEELQTVICEVESAMNSRPLTAISEESGLVPITPAKFMCDNASCLFVPEADIVDSKFLKESHGKVQKLRETIRQRFRKKYLGFLRQNTSNKTKSIKEGDVVLMEVDNKKRTEWPIGVIEKTYPGKDGIVRVAMIKTKRGNFLRPVQRLFFLESCENHSKEDFGKGRDLEKEKKINLDTPSISQRSIRGKDSPVITRSGRVVKPPDRY
ncbi:hypothetical protein LAZ67_20002726 [Cordylochernes scorpioides]|uniref:Pro-Pol polyprotein n=1 Tax=Cordylochernes scorpioides TaxID=51811 RepID=A0ABY6LLV4_9ARAC|nr:hypothetical protein LAZ67_20002726 [Cordylochernes scorpioides]